MKLKLFRHATMQLTIGNVKILIDPMLSAQGNMPPIENSPLPRANPLVELPQRESLLAVDMVLLTHCHQDHLDQAALEQLPKSLPLLCQPEDVARLCEAGFTQVTTVSDRVEWSGITISRTAGQHGHGATAIAMAPVAGYVLEMAGEPKVYITGDTVWCPAVASIIELHRPELVIAYAGGATFLKDRPITLDGSDMVQLMAACTPARVVAVHMEAFNHCLLERQALRKLIADERLHIPLDGEEIVL